MISPPVVLPRLRPFRDPADALSLHFPNKQLTFMALPAHKPPYTIRLPPTISSILNANAGGKPQSLRSVNVTGTATPAEHDFSSEAESSVQAGLSASSSTLASSMLTVATADTDLPETITEKADDPVLAAKLKKKQKSAERKKRRKEAERAAKLEPTESLVATQNNEESDSDDGRADAGRRFLHRRPSDSSSPDEDEGQPQTPANVASSAFAAGPISWAEDVQESDNVIKLDFSEMSASAAFADKPHTHSDRLNKTWRNTETPWRKSSEPASARSASPAPSSSAGWQEVANRPRKQNQPIANLKSANAFVAPRIPANNEPAWTHDRFEHHQPRFNETAKIVRDGLFDRPPETPWTARSPIPYLYNDPGSRVFYDDAQGTRKMTLRIQLKPIPDLLTVVNKRAARQRANVVELSLLLRFDEECSRHTHSPMSSDAVFVIKLSSSMPAKRVRTKEGEARYQAALEEERLQKDRLEIERVEKEKEVQLTPVLPAESAETSAPVNPATPDLATPPGLDSQIQQTASTPLSRSQSAAPRPPPQEPNFYPQEMMYDMPQPFIGSDGLPYAFDPVNNQYVPQPFGFQYPPPPFFMDPAYPMGMPMPVPLPEQMEMPTMSGNGHPSFFAPPKSQRLEIRPPPADHKLQHSRQQSTFTNNSKKRRDALVENVEVPADELIPGSYMHNGAVFFAQPHESPQHHMQPMFFPMAAPQFPPPPAFYGAPYQGLSDPAILAVSGGPQPATPQ